jgi:hypothetical protein
MRIAASRTRYSCYSLLVPQNCPADATRAARDWVCLTTGPGTAGGDRVAGRAVPLQLSSIRDPLWPTWACDQPAAPYPPASTIGGYPHALITRVSAPKIQTATCRVPITHRPSTAKPRSSQRQPRRPHQPKRHSATAGSSRKDAISGNHLGIASAGGASLG